MAIRKIALLGHPVLRQVSAQVPPDQVRSREIQQLIDDLIETMRDANGAGIAANQVHEPLQICVMEVGRNPRYPYKPPIPLTVLINPKITVETEETFRNYEGCLSVPNFRGIVERVGQVRVDALDRHGEPLVVHGRGFTAGTLQHEIDHLFGKLFVDRVKDPTTFTTWAEFDRFHRDHFLNTTVKEVLARWHQEPK